MIVMCQLFHVMTRGFKNRPLDIRDTYSPKNNSAMTHTSPQKMDISQREQRTAHHCESSRAGCLHMVLAYKYYFYTRIYTHHTK